MRKLKIGVVGAGSVAVRNHIPNLLQHPDVVLDVVCRKGAEPLEKIRSHYGFAAATENASEALSRPLDAVVVSSPHDLHYQHAREALLRGLHVFCEKPMTLDAEQAWELEQLARERGLHLIVANGWNYSPHFDLARRMIREGELGKLEAISCVHASPLRDVLAGSKGRAKWERDLVPVDLATWQSPERGGGFAHGQMAHAFALIAWLTGLRLASVSGVTSNADAAVDLYASAHFDSAQGTMGHYFGSGTVPDDRPFQLELRFFGSKGVLFLDLERPRFELVRHDSRHRFVTVQKGEWDYRLDGAMAAFLDLVRGNPAENRSPAELGAQCVEFTQALRLSARSGGAKVLIGDRGRLRLEGSTP